MRQPLKPRSLNQFQGWNEGSDMTTLPMHQYVKKSSIQVKGRDKTKQVMIKAKK